MIVARKWLATFLLLLSGLHLAGGDPTVSPGVKIGESPYLTICFEKDTDCLTVIDRGNGYNWTSSISSDIYEKQNSNALWLSSTQSLFRFSYTDIENVKLGSVKISTSAGEPHRRSMEQLADGIRLDYYFTELEIGISLELLVEGDALRVRLPATGIEENGKFGIVSIEPLPFFGASDENEDGYLFYPDGSGALRYFGHKPDPDSKNMKFSVFGPDVPDLSAYSMPELEKKNRVMLPVFGVKKETNAFLAVLVDGEYDATINVSPSGYILHLDSIAPEFIYRRTYRDPRSGTDVMDHVVLKDRFEKEAALSDREVRYTFLQGPAANYGGMANTYRQYLRSTGGLPLSRNIGEKIPLGVSIFMAISEKRLIFDNIIKMTDFKEAGLIMESLLRTGVDRLQINLIGWTKRGFGNYPLHLPPARKLGGYSGLEYLSSYARDNAIKLYLQDNFVDILDRNSGFSKKGDTVHQKNGLVLSSPRQNRYLFNPAKVEERLTMAFLPRVSRYSVDGITFERLGNTVYFDGHEKLPFTREETADVWTRCVRLSNNELAGAGAIGGNAYLLNYVDWLLCIPTADSGYFFSDESVPFYQMVVHGSIPYSSDPGNLFFDSQVQKLKWIEYGCVPYFELTYRRSSHIRNTDRNWLFASYFEDWVPMAADIFHEVNQRLGDTWRQFMVGHEKLGEELFRVRYEDGTSVYVNYGSDTAYAKGFHINPLDYLVVDADGGIR